MLKWGIRQLVPCMPNLPSMSKMNVRSWNEISMATYSSFRRISYNTSRTVLILWCAHSWHLHSIQSCSCSLFFSLSLDVAYPHIYRTHILGLYKTQYIHEKTSESFLSWLLSFLCNFSVCAEYYFHILLFERMRFIHFFCIENWVFCNKVKIYGLAFYCMRQPTIEFIVISFSCIDANTNTMLIHFKVSTILFYFSFSWVIKLQYSLRFLFHFHYYSSSIILNSSDSLFSFWKKNHVEIHRLFWVRKKNSVVRRIEKRKQNKRYGKNSNLEDVQENWRCSTKMSDTLFFIYYTFATPIVICFPAYFHYVKLFHCKIMMMNWFQENLLKCHTLHISDDKHMWFVGLSTIL